MKKAMTSTDPGSHGNPSTAVAVAANVAASAVEAAYEEGLARLKARAFERLELDERLEKLSEEVSRITTVIAINFILAHSADLISTGSNCTVQEQSREILIPFVFVFHMKLSTVLFLTLLVCFKNLQLSSRAKSNELIRATLNVISCTVFSPSS